MKLTILLFFTCALNAVSQSNWQVSSGLNYGGLYKKNQFYNNDSYRIQNSFVYTEKFLEKLDFGFMLNITKYKMIDFFEIGSARYFEYHEVNVDYEGQAIDLHFVFEKHLIQKSRYNLSIPINFGFSKMFFNEFNGLVNSINLDRNTGEINSINSVNYSKAADYKSIVYYGIGFGLKNSFKINDRISVFALNTISVYTPAINRFFVRNTSFNIGLSVNLNKKLGFNSILEKKSCQINDSETEIENNSETKPIE